MNETNRVRTLAWLLIAMSLACQVLGSSRPSAPLEQAAQEGDLELTRSLLAQGQSQYLRDSALRCAIRAGHREVIESLISSGARYALVIAAEEGDAELVKHLLAQGQEANLRDSTLHVAARIGHKEIVELLLSYGVDVNAIRWGNLTPLVFAVTAGCDFNVLSSFTNSPFSPASTQSTAANRSPAAPEAYIDIMGLLVNHGADVNLREKQRGFVPLHYAVFGGNQEIVEALLEHGAEVNPVPHPAHVRSRYVTPLHLAAHYGNLGICELLIRRGAEVNSKLPTEMGMWTSNARQTPLHHAVHSANVRLVGLLIDHGAEVNAADSEGWTPLHYAAKCKDRGLVEALLSRGADANRKSRDGQTPTSIAVQNGSVEIVRLLTSRHGDVTIHSAASMGDVAAVERLVKGGINVNRLDIRGRTALHAAVTAGQARVVEWLLAHGANLNLADDEEATPVSIALGIAQGYSDPHDPNEVARFAAMKSRQTDIIALLISSGAALGFSYGMPQETVLSHTAEVAELLIEAGRNLEPYGDSKATLLHRAAWWGNRKAVEDLIELGADVNAADSLGGTPLHAALQAGCTRYWDVITGPHAGVLELLIRNGANVNAANHEQITPLHGAAASGDTEAMELLLTNGAQVDVGTEGNWTPLHTAAARGSIDAVRLFIAKGADPNVSDGEGDTPLLLLLSSDSLTTDEDKMAMKDFVLELVRQGVQTNVQNKEGVTPLQQAAALGLPDLVEELLARGAPAHQKSATGWTALHGAVASGNAKCVKLLLQCGVPVNGLGRLPRSEQPACTPLHIAASQGDNSIIQMLIDQGADVNATDGAGKTPLHLAFEQDHPSTARLLSDKGADPNIPVVEGPILGRHGLSPIYQAQVQRRLEAVEQLAPQMPAAILTDMVFREVESGHSELIPSLVAHGADINAHESLRQETPLHRAVNGRNLKALELLLAHGADINARDENHETPLGAAVYRGYEETVSLLLLRGADVNAAYRESCQFRGGIPLHVALRYDHLEIARMLVLKGANVNAAGMWEGTTALQMALKDRVLFELMLEHGGQINGGSRDGTTVLHMAALAGQDELARYLIARGALVNVQDRNGNTPLHLAAKNGHRAVCGVLIGHKADVHIRNKKGLLPRDYAQASGIEDAVPNEGAAPRQDE